MSEQAFYCYANDGLSFRVVDEKYIAKKGEFVFPEFPTEAQIAAAFPKYAAATQRRKIISEIAQLEGEITRRMLIEHAAGSSEKGLGEDKSMTASEFIADVHERITKLREQL